MRKEEIAMVKVGLKTAAAILLLTGGALLADHLAGTNYLSYALDWWPIVFILLGLEYIWVSVRHNKENIRTRLAGGSLAFSLLIAFAAVVYMNGASGLPGTVGSLFSAVQSGQFGHSFELDPQEVPHSAAAKKIVIENENGNVLFKVGRTDRMMIETTVYVPMMTEEKAREIAEQSLVEAEGEETLVIRTKGRTYLAGQKPKMNLVITVPEQTAADWELALRNGKVEAAGLPVRDRLIIETTNGAVAISDIDGDVEVQTTNGAIQADRIRGKADLVTTNGSVSAADIAGALNAKTTNGAVKASSGEVGGDWVLRTTNGRIEVRLPENADIEADAKGSSAHTDLPLEVSNNRITGKMGTGRHKLILQTTSGSVSIMKQGNGI
jgi:hypothetical protein